MLKELRVTNIVLVENASIPFGLGFNVLSGESGSGKSAIMNALGLITGERCDGSMLRHGAAKGIVEAIFDIASYPEVLQVLSDAGIDHCIEDELFIRREISSNGKSRALINHQLAQNSLLKKITGHLLEIVGQHANQKLLSTDYQAEAVDIFGQLQPQVEAFHQSWKEETKIRQQLDALTGSEANRLKEIDTCLAEIAEIETANLKEGEEEDLFSEYTKLVNAEEIAQKVGEIGRLLNGEKSALSQLNRLLPNFDHLTRLLPQLKETAEAYNNAIMELHEIAHTIRTFDVDPDVQTGLADQLNERLTFISRMKKKYAPVISEIHHYLKETKEKLHRLENADIEIEQFQEKLKEISRQTNDLALALTKGRKQASSKLAKEMERHLKSLNMGKVDFSIDVVPQTRSRTGDDHIEFFIVPNIGEHRISICECASGGELSRIMFALQAVLAGKAHIPTIVFDEIDANIGGETAGVVGGKMRQIGTLHQVLCITHFPQVAIQADHHLRISKTEIEGRTLTIVDSLNEISRELELVRMRGGI